MVIEPSCNVLLALSAQPVLPLLAPQALARAVLNGARAPAQPQPQPQTPSATGMDHSAGQLTNEADPWRRPALDGADAAAIAAAAAEHVPPALLSRVVHVMLTVDDPRVR